MTEFTVGQAAGLLGVSADTVRRWADAGQLTVARTAAGSRRIDGADLARFATDRVTASPPSGRATARNRFTGLVTKVTTDKVMAQVEMQAGQFRIVSLVSREAVDALGLTPGMLVVASVKSTNVVIELADP